MENGLIRVTLKLLRETENLSEQALRVFFLLKEIFSRQANQMAKKTYV
jgi:hypothetical protein